MFLSNPVFVCGLYPGLCAIRIENVEKAEPLKEVNSARFCLLHILWDRKIVCGLSFETCAFSCSTVVSTPLVN